MPKDDGEWTNPLETKENDPKIEVEIEGEEKPQVIVEETKPRKTLKLENETEGGDTDDDFDKLSKRTQKRIATLTRERKEASERAAQIEQAWQTEKADLVGRLNQANQATVKTVKASTENYEKQLKDKLSMAQQTFEDAYDSGDKKKLSAAQLAISEATAALQILQVTRPQEVEQTEQKTQPRQQPQQIQRTYPPAAIDWSNERKAWFGKKDDEDALAATQYALIVDQQLTAQGYDPKDSEYYEKLDERVKKRFPEFYKEADEDEGEVEEPVQKSKRKGNQVVSGGSRTPGVTKFKMTPGQAEKARRLGVSPEAYARQQLLIDKAGEDGAYVNVFDN